MFVSLAKRLKHKSLKFSRLALLVLVVLYSCNTFGCRGKEKHSFEVIKGRKVFSSVFLAGCSL